MTTWASIEKTFCDRLGLGRRPISVSFLDEEPAHVPRFEGREPSGCSFWRLASQGKVFYTVPADHYNCAIGSYTHNIPLPLERAGELDETLSLMFGINYIRSEEIPGITRLPSTPRAILYAPLGEAPVDPAVGLFACRAAAAMLLYESGIRAGVGSSFSLMGRPTCMALPATLAHGTSISLGCIGNRVYTDLGDDELYCAVPGPALPKVADALEAIVTANEQLRLYAMNRRQELSREHSDAQAGVRL